LEEAIMKQRLISIAVSCGVGFAVASAAVPSFASESMTPATGSASAQSESAMTTRSGGVGTSNAQTVRQVQQALKDKGHDPGAIDGVMGAKTRAALRSYQSSQNLTGSTGLDAKTMESLGITASATRTPTAGGNSAEPDKSGRPATGGTRDMGANRSGSSTPNPSAGGNSAEPDRSGRPSSGSSAKDMSKSSSSGSMTPNPTAGGNSAEPEKTGRAK